MSPIQIAPAPEVMPRPAAPTSTVLTLPSFGLMRDTLASSTFDTQTAPSPNVTAVGLLPTRIGSPTTSFASGSMRETVPERLFATQMSPAPKAIPVGPSPTEIVSRSSCDSASMRETLFVSELVTQIEFPAEATRVGVGTSETSSSIAPVAGFTTPTEFALSPGSELGPEPPPPNANTGIAIAAAIAPAREPITTGLRYNGVGAGATLSVLSGAKSVSNPSIRSS
jgi:hypothetical protein